MIKMKKISINNDNKSTCNDFDLCKKWGQQINFKPSIKKKPRPTLVVKEKYTDHVFGFYLTEV